VVFPDSKYPMIHSLDGCCYVPYAGTLMTPWQAENSIVITSHTIIEWPSDADSLSGSAD